MTFDLASYRKLARNLPGRIKHVLSTQYRTLAVGYGGTNLTKLSKRVCKFQLATNMINMRRGLNQDFNFSVFLFEVN